MERQLIIIVCYMSREFSAHQINEARQQMKGLTEHWPADIRERYFVMFFFISSDEETRMDCIFPTNPDEDTVAKIKELGEQQKKTFIWLQQQLQGEA